MNGNVLSEVYPENFQAIPEICSKIPNDLQYCFSLFFSRQLFFANLPTFQHIISRPQIGVVVQKIYQAIHILRNTSEDASLGSV